MNGRMFEMVTMSAEFESAMGFASCPSERIEGPTRISNFRVCLAKNTIVLCELLLNQLSHSY